ncbi:hypothetical protein NKH77_00610 [Streptomyces sp. M19]
MAVVQHPRPAAPPLAPPSGTASRRHPRGRARRRRPGPGRRGPGPRAVGLRRQGSMWRDEAVTYDMAHRGLSGLADIAPHHDTVHVLYYFLMRGVFGAFGDSLVALRLPSVLGWPPRPGRRGAGAPAGGTRRRAAGRGDLLGAARRAAVRAGGRSYGLVCAAVVWATVLFVHAARVRRPGPWAGYAVVSLGACLLHEFAVLALLAHGATLLVTRASGDLPRAWATAAGCVAAGWRRSR